ATLQTINELPSKNWTIRVRQGEVIITLEKPKHFVQTNPHSTLGKLWLRACISREHPSDRSDSGRPSASGSGLLDGICRGYSISVVPPPSEYDDELLKVHLQQASDALPGPDYYTVLRWIHEVLRPANYVEIGVRQGDSLRAALPDTHLHSHRPGSCPGGTSAPEHSSIPRYERHVL